MTCAYCHDQAIDTAYATNGKAFPYCWRLECWKAVLEMVKRENANA